jgi:hypothetical protein
MNAHQNAPIPDSRASGRRIIQKKVAAEGGNSLSKKGNQKEEGELFEVRLRRLTFQLQPAQ